MDDMFTWFSDNFSNREKRLPSDNMSIPKPVVQLGRSICELLISYGSLSFIYGKTKSSWDTVLLPIGVQSFA